MLSSIRRTRKSSPSRTLVLVLAVAAGLVLLRADGRPVGPNLASANTKVCKVGSIADNVIKSCKAAKLGVEQTASALYGTVALMKIKGYEKDWVLGRGVFKHKTLIYPGKPKKVDLTYVRGKVLAHINAGATNKQLMQMGYAPIGPDGAPVNLHHLFGVEPGPMVEVEAAVHRKYNKVLHQMIEESFRNDSSLEYAYDKFRKAYWKERAKTL